MPSLSRSKSDFLDPQRGPIFTPRFVVAGQAHATLSINGAMACKICACVAPAVLALVTRTKRPLSASAMRAKAAATSAW